MLTFRDYHPFLHVKSLLEQIAKQAGYTIQSQFFASDLFNSLYISGAYPEKDTGLLLERMGFLAKRFQPAEATADRFGRVYADPLTSSIPSAISSIVPIPMKLKMGKPFRMSIITTMPSVKSMVALHSAP